MSIECARSSLETRLDDGTRPIYARLIVCNHNAGRSQMAQASSSVTRPTARRSCLREMQLHADWAITMGCGDACPYVPTTVRRGTSRPAAAAEQVLAGVRQTSTAALRSSRLARAIRTDPPRCFASSCCRPRRIEAGPAACPMPCSRDRRRPIAHVTAHSGLPAQETAMLTAVAMPRPRPLAVITDIHGNLPALEAALARIDELGIEEHLLRRRPGRLRAAPERGVRADRRARDPDDLRQLRLRDRARPRRLRLRVHHARGPRARPAVGRVDARAHRPAIEGLHARVALRPALRGWASATCTWCTARRARSTSTSSRTSRPACTSASPVPRPTRCSSSATPTSHGCTATAASCSSTAARSASPRTATRAARSRSCGPAPQGIEVTIERVEYDAEAVAREVAAVGLPREYADKLLIAA